MNDQTTQDENKAAVGRSDSNAGLERFWNWKKYPESVFYIAVPLASLGFGLHIMRGVLELTRNGDPWFLVISIFSVALLVFALYPLRKHLLRSNVGGKRDDD